jgi:hypothetical protein
LMNYSAFKFISMIELIFLLLEPKFFFRTFEAPTWPMPNLTFKNSGS